MFFMSYLRENTDVSITKTNALIVFTEIIAIYYDNNRDRDSSVGIATGYRLDDPGIESREG
jgi:hypothetical protein